MKKKKLFTVGVVALAALTLSACSAKNSDAAKKAFISDATTLNNSKVYNSQELNVKVDKFKATGDNADSMNKYLNGATFDINVGLDSDNQLASLGGKIKVDNKAYNLNMLMSEKGLYLNSADIKTLYNDNKGLIPKSDEQVTMVYGAMVDSLTKPYFFLDANTLNSANSSSSENWDSTFKDMFKQTQTIKKSDLEKAFKDVPNSDFTKNGDKTTLKISGKNGDFKDLIKGFTSVNPSIPKDQLDSILKESKDVNFDNLSMTMVIDGKAHTIDASFTGKVSDTKEKSTIDFKLSLASKRNKLKEALKEPSTSDAETMAELQAAAIDKLQAQFSTTQ
ncbi:MAG: hypothetical protein FWH31_10230 [Streptococcaceae bacterium]|nr:hypothetical protein [Streptococcaceae bacterium]